MHGHYHTIAYRCSSIKFSHTATVYARDSREAAEKFTSLLFQMFDEKFSVAEVQVKEANDHFADTINYRVDVRIEPVFNAYSVGGFGVLNVEP